MSAGAAELLSSPYGESSYEQIRSLKKALADKSSMILALDDLQMTRFPLLLRPPQFGKSTFVQMLKCFYDISYKDRYDELFAGTDIYNANLKSHNTYHVLDIDFSQVSTRDEEEMYSSFLAAVTSGISQFKDRYPDFTFEFDSLSLSDPVSLFTQFESAYIRYSREGRLYLMIDAYDGFACRLLSRDPDLLRSSFYLLRDFYATIKAATANACSIAKIFITGESSISLDSITTVFNIALDVSSYRNLVSYAGLTEEELQKLIPELVDVAGLGTTADELIALMKPVYGGYCFSRFAGSTLYSPSLCLHYLVRVQKDQEILPPEQILDPASDPDGTGLSRLFDCAEKGLPAYIAGSCLRGDPFLIDRPALNIRLNTAKFNRDQLLSLLFYHGYLAIDRKLSSSDRLVLKIPNIFVAKQFAKHTAAFA